MQIQEIPHSAVAGTKGLTPPDTWDQALERFARDLLILTKVSSVYPEGHPGTLLVAQRLCDWSSAEQAGEVALGFTPSKLLFRDRFFGAPGSRCESLAALFHGRKIMRMTWAARVSVDDVKALAYLLARSRSSGTDLRSELHAARLYSIDLEPLDAGKIHSTLIADDHGFGSSDDPLRRGLDAWLWLQDEAIKPHVLARALTSGGFWSLGEAAPSSALQLVLRQLSKLPEALSLLSESDQARVKSRFSELRNALSMSELSSLVLAAATATTQPEDTAFLLNDLTPETVIDLMAEMAGKGSAAAVRAGFLLRQLSPRFGTQELLALIEAKISSELGPAHALNVWQTLGAFLLEGDEEQFFSDHYMRELEGMSEAQAEGGPRASANPFLEDAETHVDRICFDLSLEGDPEKIVRLRRRISGRVNHSPFDDLLSMTKAAVEEVPAVFEGQTKLARDIFARVLKNARILDDAGRRASIEFARSQESAILEPAITALILERRIVNRRFLVSVLSALSPETTSEMLQRASNAPWYYLRNVATVLGRRGCREDGPVLEALLGHPHDKVRREALRGLSRIGGAALRALADFAANSSRPTGERSLARSLLHRRGLGGDHRPST